MVAVSDCHALFPPSNGWVFSKDLSSSHGNHATISCNDGYALLGERTLICLSGTWSGSVGTCETVKGKRLCDASLKGKRLCDISLLKKAEYNYMNAMKQVSYIQT